MVPPSVPPAPEAARIRPGCSAVLAVSAPVGLGRGVPRLPLPWHALPLPAVSSAPWFCIPCRFQWLTWIGSHRKVRCIARPHGMVGSDHLDRLAATDRFHGDPGLELWTVGAALAQLLRRRLRLGRESPSQGRYPASEVNDGACAEKPDQLLSHATPIVIGICANAMAPE